MNGLGRYFCLTMAPHQIFATAIACELELENGLLKWVNAGHPPGFVCSPDRETIELDTTAIMLGAALPEDFEFEQKEVMISKGDLIGLYTDGVTEARSTKAELLGLNRLRKIVEDVNINADWAKSISATAQEFSRGMIDDDILTASLQYKERSSHDALKTT
jgi:serine phosphatase RsbU (regulator of sigma subunit)